MITRNFPGNFKSLAPISDFVVAEAEAAGFSPNDVYAIQTAVDEACANIIDHAYGGEDIGDIQISIRTLENGLQIILRDNGEPFNPDEGVFFMRKLMDEVKFCFSSQRGNTLTLIKYKGS